MSAYNTILGEPVFSRSIKFISNTYTYNEKLNCETKYSLTVSSSNKLAPLEVPKLLSYLHELYYYSDRRNNVKMVILVPGDEETRTILSDIPYIVANHFKIDYIGFGKYELEFTVPRQLNTGIPMEFIFMDDEKLEAHTRFRDNKMPTDYHKFFTGSFELNLIDNKPKIKKVIFNNPATIVFWEDGTKTVVKAGDGDIYDPEKGLAMAFAKKFLGNKGNFNEVFKKYLKEYHEREVEKETAKKVAKKKTTRKKTVKKSK